MDRILQSFRRSKRSKGQGSHPTSTHTSARSSPDPHSSGQPIDSGIYTITNVHYSRFVYLEDPNDDTPLRGHFRPGNRNAQWHVRSWGNEEYSIQNVEHNRYAYCGPLAGLKASVEGYNTEWLWNIQVLPTGEYTIATTDTGNLWMLPYDGPGTPVELFNVHTDPRCRWTFEKQDTDPEVLEPEPYLSERLDVYAPKLSGQFRRLNKGTDHPTSDSSHDGSGQVGPALSPGWNAGKSKQTPETPIQSHTSLRGPLGKCFPTRGQDWANLPTPVVSGRSTPDPRSSDPLIDSGIYTITNVRYSRFVYLEDPNDDTPLRGHFRPGNRNAQWHVRSWGNEEYSIQNVEHNRYAYCGPRAGLKASVEGYNTEWLWNIQVLPTGEYTIATTDTGNLWMLLYSDPDTPVELFNVHTDPRCWWTFKKQDTDLEVLKPEPYPAERLDVPVPKPSGQFRRLNKGTDHPTSYSGGRSTSELGSGQRTPDPSSSDQGGQRILEPNSSGQSIDNGIYTITNVHHKRFVYLENGDDKTPLRGHYDPEHRSFRWQIKRWVDGEYSIENVGYSRYANCESRPGLEDCVEGHHNRRLWRIRESLVGGQYTIAEMEKGNLWKLPDNGEDTPVTFSKVPTDPMCQWTFKSAEIATPVDQNLMTQPILFDADLDVLESEPYLAEHFGVHVPNLSGQVRRLKKGTTFSGTYSTVYPGVYGGKKVIEVAIKVLRMAKESDNIERKFRRELLIWSRLKHDNVLPLYGYLQDEEGGDVFPSLISKWAEHGSAAQYITGDLRWDQRASLFYDIAKGLNYLHGFKPRIVHADLKPQNVLVHIDGVGQLCDFGLTRFVQDELKSGFTTTTAHTGTTLYLAYELVDYEDKPIPTTATDMYALGCLGLEFIYRIPPHASLGIHLGKIIRAIGDGKPPAKRPANPKEAVPILWDLVEACWINDPEQRPTATQVSEYLEKNLAALSESLIQCWWRPECSTR